MKKKTVFIFFFALIVLLVLINWHFKFILGIPTTGIPGNYIECTRNLKSSYNKVDCEVIFYGENSEVEKCLNMGGCNPNAADGPYGCEISFFNPHFTYPQSREECAKLYSGRFLSMLNSITLPGSSCYVFINPSCNGNKDISDRVIEQCPDNYQKETKFGVTTCEKAF